MRVCARALAAALMMGAVAGVLGFPTLFPTGKQENHVLVAPPSSQQRTLRLPALRAPARHVVTVHAARRPVVSEPRATSTPVGSTAGIAPLVVRPKTLSPQSVVTPQPATPAEPAPQAPPSEPASTAAAAPPAEAPRELAAAPPAPVVPPVVPAAPEPATPPSQPDDEDENGDDGDDGHGNGHAYGHDKHADAAEGADAAGDDDPGHGHP